jgi:hypothetical protein
MRNIPVIFWVAAGKWTETSEMFLDEDVIEWRIIAGHVTLRGCLQGEYLDPMSSSSFEIWQRPIPACAKSHGFTLNAWFPALDNT